MGDMRSEGNGSARAEGGDKRVASPQSGRRELWPALVPWLLVALAAVVPFLTALPCGFAYDDGGLIRENPAVAPDAPWWQCLTHPYWPAPHAAGLYRPLTSLTYRLQREISGDAALPFHAFNVLLHAGVALLVLCLLRRAVPHRPHFALAVALLFAVHPLHTEAVTNVIGRAELLAALFGLGAYVLWLRGPARLKDALLPCLGFALAAASKENALAWLLVVAAHRAGLFSDGRSYRALAAAGGSAHASPTRVALRQALVADAAGVAGFAIYLAARTAVLGALIGSPQVSPVDNPIHAAPLVARWLTAWAVLARGVGLTVFPLHLSADYSFNAIPIQTRALGPGLLALFLALPIAALAVRARRAHPLYLWSLALYGALVLPVSNLLLPIGTIFAERLLYLPSLGIMIAVAAGACALLSRVRLRPVAPYLLAAVLVLLAGRTWVRNPVWTDDATLFEATAAEQPRSAKARTNLATVRSHAEQWSAAEAEYREALRIDPGYLAALNGLGHALLMQQRYDEARTVFEAALTRQPHSLETLTRLGNLLLEVRQPAAALARFEEAGRIAPRSGDAAAGRASALFMLGRYDESVTAWERACELAAPGTELRPHLAAAYRQAGRASDAQRILSDLVRAHPDEARYAHDLARALVERGDTTATALRVARRAVELAPTAEHMTTLIDALLLCGDCGQATAVLSSAEVARLDPETREALHRRVADACP
jgi:tetratricopeptide (TPR) repeat protein